MKYLDDFFSTVEAILNSPKFENCKYPVFRGHSNHTYKLLPTLHRQLLGTGKDIWHIENQLFFEFRSLAGSKIHLPSSWDTLFIMRHEGIPTRLLDWTENIGTALFFALNDKTPDNPHIWVLDPYSLNKRIPGKEIGLKTPDEDLNNYAKIYANYYYEKNTLIPEFPEAIYPTRSNDRLLAQKGLFTIHGTNEDEMEKTCEFCLEKIEIPISSIENLNKLLKYFGINSYTVYPDLKGLSEYIWKTYDFK